MQVTVNQKVESSHAWVDRETGKVRNAVIVARAGDVLDSDSLTGLARVVEDGRASTQEVSVGDAERALERLVRLGYAE